jgi:hypothetical protein
VRKPDEESITAAIKRINCRGSACPAQLGRGEQRPYIRIALFNCRSNKKIHPWKEEIQILLMEADMKRFRKIVPALIVMCCFIGCGSNDYNDTIGLQEVTFVDKGAVVANPISTTVSIDPNSIKYSQSQSDKVTNEWSKHILFSDYTSVRKVISDNKLYESEDVVPSSQFPCMGSQGMTIRIKKDNNVHSFDIVGGAYCNRSQWPSGVRELVDLKDALVEKYTGP